MGNSTEFERAVLWLSQNITFDVDARVNLFEVCDWNNSWKSIGLVDSKASCGAVWINQILMKQIANFNFSMSFKKQYYYILSCFWNVLMVFFPLGHYGVVQHKSSWRTSFCSYTCNWFYKQVGSCCLQESAAYLGWRFRETLSTCIQYTHWVAICMD